METDLAYIERRVGGPLKELNQFPKYFEIETINACQAKCPMCTIGDWNRKDGVMKDDLFEKIACEIEENAHLVKRVQLYRDGEPVLDKKLARRTARMKEAGVKNVGISTNVELLDGGKAVAILEAGMDEIILSIDSINKPIYDKIRVGLDFDTVLINARNLFKIRDHLESKCRIRVRMIRQQSNNQEWADGSFQAYWRQYTGPLDFIEAKDIHAWGNQLAGFQGIAPAESKKPCIALWSLMAIFANGTVPLCGVDYNAKFPLGNVKDTSIAELWQSAEQERRRKVHRDEISICNGCTVWTESVVQRLQ